MIDKSLFTFTGVRRTLGLLSLLSLVQAFCIVGQAHGLTSGLVQVWKLHTVSSLWGPLAEFFSCYLLRQLIDVAKQRLAANQADAVVTELHPRIQEKVFRLGPASLAQRGTGASVTMLIDGLDQVKNYLQIVLPKMTDMMLIPPVILVYVWIQHWVSGLVLLLMFPLLIFFMAILGLASRDRSNKQYAQFRILNSKFVDSILGLPTLKMLGVSEQYEDEIYSVSEQFRKRTISVIRVAMTSTFALDFFATLGIAIMAVFLGIDLIDGKMALAPAMLALILAPDYFLPIRQFGENYHATLDGKNAMSDVMAFLNTPDPDVDESLEWDGWNEHSELHISGLDFAYDGAKAEESDAQSAGHSTAMQAVEQQRPAKTRNSDGDVPEDGIHEPDDALHDVSLDVSGFAKVAVIGRSGSGKTTLVDVMAGFNQPQRGAIELDGHELHHFNAPAWQRHVSYIPQTPYIFSGTIADNIRFYVEDATEQAVSEAARQAGLDGWLAQLPEGLETRIGEGNRGVSGGQAQRIALARVLLDKSREILLFDEPTAHLDIETEYELKQTLLPIMEGHLVIFATHRLHWLSNVDQVVMLDHGHVVESGTPEELIGSGGPLDELIVQMGGNRIDGYRRESGMDNGAKGVSQAATQHKNEREDEDGE